MAEGLWLADGMWHKMCDSLTELEMSVNAWVAFAPKNCSSADKVGSKKFEN